MALPAWKEWEEAGRVEPMVMAGNEVLARSALAPKTRKPGALAGLSSRAPRRSTSVRSRARNNLNLIGIDGNAVTQCLSAYMVLASPKFKCQVNNVLGL